MIDPLKKYLTFTPLVFTRNPVTHFVAPAPYTLSERESLRYFLEIWAPQNSQSPVFEKITTLEGREKPPMPPFTTSDGVTFLVNAEKNGLLDSILVTAKPAFQQSAISVVSTLTTPYYVTEKIQGGAPPQNSAVNRSVQWAYKGGLSGFHHSAYRSVFFTQHLEQRRSFLTFQPVKKFIGPAQEEYLYFLLNFTPLPQQVRVRVLITHQDGTQELVTRQTLSRLIANQVLCLPVGPQVLQLDGVRSYKLWLADEANRRLSEVREFVLDPASYVTDSYVLFANSLGAFDTVRFTGQRLTTLRAEKEFFTGVDEDFQTRVKVLSGSITREYALNTGYIGRDVTAVTNYLSELVYSSEHYLVTESGHLPVTLNQEEYISGQSAPQELIHHDFIFQEALVSASFSVLPAIAPIQDRPTTYLPIDLFYLLRSDGYRSGYIKGARLKQIYADTLEDVLPLRIKPNAEGDPDYIEPFYEESVAGTTPNPSLAINRQGSYKRQTCGGITVPGYATIIIPAGAYGGETADQANALAEAEYQRTNTQEYANEYGVCHEGPWIYEQAVPAGYAFFRINLINSSYAANAVSKWNDASTEQKGNGWFVWGPNQSASDVYPSGRWDILLPTDFGATKPWRFAIYSASSRIRIFVNGESIYDANPPREAGGVANVAIPHASIPSGAKVYVQID